MAQNMAWNTGMKLQKGVTKYHVNPPARDVIIEIIFKRKPNCLEHIKSHCPRQY